MADAEKIVHDVAERVREMVTEAEQRAAEIVSEAEGEAKRIRDRAEAEARERLAEVSSALDEVRGKLGSAGGGGAASPGPAEPHVDPTAAAEAEVEPGPATIPEPEPPDVPEPTPDPVPDPVPSPEPVPEPSPDPMPEPEPPPDEGTPPAAANGARSDEVGARLVALNMALEGASREQIEAKLAADYDLEDRAKLLDEVIAAAGK
ncbi:MAG: hypothetical protein ACRDK9_02195 [Solirubrobacterales bacterium]